MTRFEKNVELIQKKWYGFLNNCIDLFRQKNSLIPQSNKINAALIIAIAVIIWCIMFFLNRMTVYCADDFAYQYVFTNGSMKTTGNTVDSFRDIFDSMKAHYFYTNGRVVTHSIVQFFMWMGNPVFNIFNSAVYVILSVLIYIHCVGTNCKKHSALLFLAINLGMWTFLKCRGCVTLWTTGSINYLWTSAARLAILLPVRKYADTGVCRLPVLKAAIMIPLGFFAGATSENMSAVFIGMTVLFMIYCKVNKYKLKAFMFTSLISAACGFAFMILSPANGLRNEHLAKDMYASNIVYRIGVMIVHTVLNIGAIAVCFIVLSLMLYYYNRKTGNYSLSIPFIYFLGSLAGVAVMVVSPRFPGRVWFGIIVLALIALFSLFYQIDRLPKIFNAIALSALCVWIMICAAGFSVEVRNIKAETDLVKSREQYIYEQKQLGNRDIELEPFESLEEYLPYYEHVDVKDDKDFWLNECMARYYGVDSIVKGYPEQKDE